MALLRDNPADFAAIVGATAADRRIRPVFVEKDYWVTELLRSVFAPLGTPEEGHLISPVFKGGTSLSKVWEIIDRFSEDVDVLAMFNDAASVKQRDAVLRGIVQRAGSDTGLTKVKEWATRGRDRNAEYSYGAIADPGDLEPRIRLELSIRGGSEPHERVTISSYVAQYATANDDIDALEFDDFAPLDVLVLRPERTLVEKLMCLHTAATSDGETEPGRDVRHYYDVHELLQHDGVRRALSTPGTTTQELAGSIHAESRRWGYDSRERPTGGFSTSPAFDPDGNWCRRVAPIYAETLDQLAWGDVPAFRKCLEAVEAASRDL